MKYMRFIRILSHVCKNFYSNVIDIKSIEEEINRQAEEEKLDKTQKAVKVNISKSIEEKHKKSAFIPNKVTFFDEMKQGNKTSYTFVEAMILVSGLLAAHNKESNDLATFGFNIKTKNRKNKVKNGEQPMTISHYELGKTKKFSMERMLTIFQYFLSNFCEESEEFKLYHHSINVYSKINTFVSENLFKRSQGRNEDPSAVSLKINYDRHLIDDVLKQFPDIKIMEYLDEGKKG